MTAILNSHLQKAEKIRSYMVECAKKGIQILPPDLNSSEISFSVENNAIRFGLKGLKNVGSASSQIIECRERHGKFRSYQDTVKRLSNENVNKAVFESLIYGGVLDSFEGTRNAKLDALENMIQVGKSAKERKKTGRVSLLDWVLENKNNEITNLGDFFEVKIKDLEELDKRFKLEQEYEVAGLYITEHPIDRFAHTLLASNVSPISLLLDNDEEEEMTFFEDDVDVEANLSGESDTKLSDGDEVVIAGIIKDFEIKHTRKDNSAFAVFKLEDRSGIVKVVCFTKEYARNQKALEEGKIVKIKGRFKKTDFGVEVHGLFVDDLESKESKTKLNRIDVRGVAELEPARQQFLTLLTLARTFQGDIPLFFHNQVNGMIYEVPEKINVTSDVLEKINEIFGIENIAFS